jgi:hypothetical protein
MNTLKTYVIWSQSKVESYAKGLDADCSTYAGLLAVEAVDDCSISSNVVTPDIKELMSAIYNESDIDMCYEEIQMPIEFILYKSCDADYSQSVEDGALCALNTHGIYEAKGEAYEALKANAHNVADCLGRADDLSYVAFDAYGNFLDCGTFKAGY